MTADKCLFDIITSAEVLQMERATRASRRNSQRRPTRVRRSPRRDMGALTGPGSPVKAPVLKDVGNVRARVPTTQPVLEPVKSEKNKPGRVTDEEEAGLRSSDGEDDQVNGFVLHAYTDMSAASKGGGANNADSDPTHEVEVVSEGEEADWRSNLKVGDLVDLADKRNPSGAPQWEVGKVIEDYGDALKFHYMMWDTKWDITLPRHDEQIAPLMTHTDYSNSYLRRMKKLAEKQRLRAKEEDLYRLDDSSAGSSPGSDSPTSSTESSPSQSPTRSQKSSLGNPHEQELQEVKMEVVKNLPQNEGVGLNPPSLKVEVHRAVPTPSAPKIGSDTAVSAPNEVVPKVEQQSTSNADVHFSAETSDTVLSRKRRLRFNRRESEPPSPKPEQPQQKKQRTKGEEVPQNSPPGLDEDENDVFCSVCLRIQLLRLKEEAQEAPAVKDANTLLCCDGPCGRSFHLSCLGLSSIPEEDPWFCEACKHDRQPCFICGRTVGRTGRSETKTLPCAHRSCRKFYHEKCVMAHPLTRLFTRKTDSRQAGGRAEERSRDARASAVASGSGGKVSAAGSNTPPFLCPLHTCGTCEQKASAGGGVITCMLCPTSYHSNCVGPSVRFNELLLLCGDHPDVELPDLPEGFGEDAVNMEQGNFVFHFPELPLPRQLPRREKALDAHFRIPSGIVDEVQKVPPFFQQIRRSVKLCIMPKVKAHVEKCHCVGTCGEGCINRLMQIECVGQGRDGGKKKDSSSSNSSSGGGSSSRHDNCNVGPGCGNRALQHREYPPLQYKRMGGKGWGLLVLEDVPAGKLVIEYVGEIIDEEQNVRRLADHRKNFPQDNNTYIMELCNERYIDARYKGNLSRFINHSCDPCCVLQKWNVGGSTRIGIYALRDIAKNEELSYDYQLFTKEATKFRCLCGTKKCRGTLASKTTAEIQATLADERLMAQLASGRSGKQKRLSRKEKNELIKARRRAEKRDIAAVARQHIADCRRLSLTSQKTPGEDSVPIRAGPSRLDHSFAREHRLFLFRNARRGFNFLKRKKLWMRREGKARKAQGTAEEE